MSNTRSLRPSICRAVNARGEPLTKRPVFRDPGTSVQTPPHPVRVRPEPKRHRGSSGKPMSTATRLGHYMTGTGRSVITAAQTRRANKKARRQKRLAAKRRAAKRASKS